MQLFRKRDSRIRPDEFELWVVFDANGNTLHFSRVEATAQEVALKHFALNPERPPTIQKWAARTVTSHYKLTASWNLPKSSKLSSSKSPSSQQSSE